MGFDCLPRRLIGMADLDGARPLRRRLVPTCTRTITHCCAIRTKSRVLDRCIKTPWMVPRTLCRMPQGWLSKAI